MKIFFTAMFNFFLQVATANMNNKKKYKNVSHLYLPY